MPRVPRLPVSLGVTRFAVAGRSWRGNFLVPPALCVVPQSPQSRRNCYLGEAAAPLTGFLLSRQRSGSRTPPSLTEDQLRRNAVEQVHRGRRETIRHAGQPKADIQRLTGKTLVSHSGKMNAPVQLRREADPHPRDSCRTRVWHRAGAALAETSSPPSALVPAWTYLKAASANPSPC